MGIKVERCIPSEKLCPGTCIFLYRLFDNNYIGIPGEFFKNKTIKFMMDLANREKSWVKLLPISGLAPKFLEVQIRK